MRMIINFYTSAACSKIDGQLNRFESTTESIPSDCVTQLQESAASALRPASVAGDLGFCGRCTLHRSEVHHDLPALLGGQLLRVGGTRPNTVADRAVDIAVGTILDRAS